MAGKIHCEPSTVSAEQGEVQLDGPGGLAMAMTPDAATETSKRLRTAAERAQSQLSEARQTPETDSD